MDCSGSQGPDGGGGEGPRGGGRRIENDQRPAGNLAAPGVRRRIMMRKKPNILREPPSDYGGDAIVLYSDPDGAIKLDVRLVRETLWLSQKQMALLFDTERSVITKHFSNI